MAKIGVVYPQTEFGNDPAAIRDYTQTAEALGYEHILAYDHVLGANPERPGGWSGPYTHQTPFMEPFTLFSYMAAVTTKIGYATGVIILPQRQTALVAKQAATLDVLCSGRLRLGVGLGWNYVEYQALNEDFHTRGRRIEEQVEVLRLLFTQPLVDYAGGWHHIESAGLNPLPIQRPIPIWFGGSAEPALQRAARLGDGWMTNYRRIAQAQASINLLRNEVENAGRQWNEFGIEARLHYNEGDPREWEAIFKEWQAEKITHFSFNTMGSKLASPAAHIAAIQLFAKELGVPARA